MSLSIEPRQGIRLSLSSYLPIKAWQGGGELLDGEFQLIVGQIGLASFLPRAAKDDKSILYKLMADGREVVSESVPISTLDQVPPAQVTALKTALGELKAKAEDPLCDANKKRMIEAFRLPDPQQDPELYRLVGRGREQRLIVLWGVEKERGSALVPLQALARVPQGLASGGIAGRKWLVALALLLLLMVAGWLFLNRTQPARPVGNGNSPSGAPTGESTPSGDTLPMTGLSNNPTAPFIPGPRPSAGPGATVSPGTSSDAAGPGGGNPAGSSALAGVGTPRAARATSTPPARSGLASSPSPLTAPSAGPDKPEETPPAAEAAMLPGRLLNAPSASTPPISSPASALAVSPSPARSPALGEPSSKPSGTPNPSAKPAGAASPSPGSSAASSPASSSGAPPTPLVSASPLSPASSPANRLATPSAANRPALPPGQNPIAAAQPVATALKIGGFRSSNKPNAGNMDISLEVTGRDERNNAISAPTITRWTVDGVVQLRDGQPVTGTTLSVPLAKGTHRVSVSGTSAEGKPLQDEAVIDVDVQVKVQEEGTAKLLPATP